MNEKRPPGCENCKKQCTIHLTQIINGEVQKVDMCATCPKAQNIQDPVELGLMEQLLGIAMKPSKEMSEGRKCDVCGYSEAQFRKKGRVGCAHCYEVFIMPRREEILDKIHPSLIHKGKVPKNLSKKASRSELIKLKEKLKDLIREENYEEAAVIRDKIKALSDKSGNNKKINTQKVK